MVKKNFNAKRYIIILVALGLGGVIAGYIMTANSAAFSAAQTFLTDNPKVIEFLGPIRSSRLGLNYNVHNRGGAGTAKINVILNGERKSADAYVTLEMIDGVWQVNSGNLIVDNMDPISLSPPTNN
jgi:hypothetical protein